MRGPRFLAIVLALVGCAETTGPDCGGTAPVDGDWEYHAEQTTPLPGAMLVGELAVSEVDGCDFSGALSVDETPNGGGSTVTYAGPLFGIAVNDSVVNFDADLKDGPARVHTAQVFGDSLAGEWIEGSGGSALRGTFWARRITP
jgi:hypothetical protein